jgi:hypothetical protein
MGVWVAAAILGSCGGKAANVLSSPPVSDAGGDGASGNTTGTADGNGIGGSSNGEGGPSNGVGGNVSTADASTGFEEPPGAGASSGADASSGAGSAGVPDPHADERRTLVTAYCATVKTYGCLEEPYPGQDCVAKTTVDTFGSVPASCWSELETAMTCSINYPYECGRDISIAPFSGGLVNGGPCFAERSDVDACTQRARSKYSGTVSGTRGNYYWWQNAGTGACETDCIDDPLRVFAAICSGPSAGPVECSCLMNARAVVDDLELHNNSFTADDCENAARKMADGQCARVFDCCYTWQGAIFGDGPIQELCSCTADPTAGGFTSCEDAAAKGGGHVVALCPQYAPYGAVIRPGADGGL